MNKRSIILTIVLVMMCVHIGFTQVLPGTYRITSQLTDRRLDIMWMNQNNGAGFHLWDKNDGDAQIFIVENSNEDGFSIIKSKWGKCFDVDLNNTRRLQMWDCHTGDNQKWRINGTGDGHYSIQSKLGTCVNVKDAKSDNGTEINMLNCRNNAAQRWKIQDIDAPIIIDTSRVVVTNPRPPVVVPGTLPPVVVPNRCININADAGDCDNDGLSDTWETSGFGPINPTLHGTSARRQDVFLVVVIRPGMMRSQVEPTLDKVRSFFASLPTRNPDGTTGINVITVWGNRLPASDSTTDYRAVYERGMPIVWRGIGHGLLIEQGTNGGGQANRPDWAVSTNNWKTIVHELGHQFGLGHVPPNSSGQSPLYTSLMNYDYDDSFNGNGDAIHFSQGKFASVRLNETNLDEQLQFPEADLQFLTRSPYHFQIRSAGPNVTYVDWNRNGRFGERSVRADINDGYAVSLREEHRLGKTAGSPSLVVYGDLLHVIYPDLRNSTRYNGYEAASLSNENSGSIVVRSYNGRTWTEKATLAQFAHGDPHAAVMGGQLFVAFPITNSYMIQVHDAIPPFRRRSTFAALDDVKPGQQRHPVLVRTRANLGIPEQLWLFLWNETNSTITYRKVETGTAAAPGLRLGPVQELRIGIGETSSQVMSQFPIHAAYDTSLERIILVTSGRHNGFEGRTILHTLGRTGEFSWYSQNASMTMGSEGYSRSRARPWILYDPSRLRGANGGYLVYLKGDVSPANVPADTWLVRTIADVSSWNGWRTTLMGNNWLTTRSSPAAAFYGNDIAYAVRWFGGDLDNELLVNLRASGITDGIIADHDDLTFIRRTGLRKSLVDIRPPEDIRDR